MPAYMYWLIAFDLIALGASLGADDSGAAFGTWFVINVLFWLGILCGLGWR